jgi:hypothetical protein
MFAPSGLVSTRTSFGACAQFTWIDASDRALDKRAVQVTVSPGLCEPAEHQYPDPGESALFALYSGLPTRFPEANVEDAEAASAATEEPAAASGRRRRKTITTSLEN